jgi:hypothetical protein
MSVITRVTAHYIPEDGTLHSHCRDNRKSYNLTVAFVSADDNYLLRTLKEGVAQEKAESAELLSSGVPARIGTWPRECRISHLALCGRHGSFRRICCAVVVCDAAVCRMAVTRV